jgi:hypothetical protein
MYGATESGCELIEVMQVELEILLGMETDRAIVAALNDVPRYTGYREACATRHGVSSLSIYQHGIKNRGLSYPRFHGQLN